RGMPLAEAPTLTRPDGSQQPLPADARRLTGLDAPGYYAISGVEGPALLAVNVDPAETETSPLPAEAFEQLGAPLAGRPRPAADEQRLAQLRDVELESRQRWWQWLRAVVLGLLAAETWLAGRLSHRLDAPLTPA
ncbi:MAG TPA: hypothetical protein PKC18_19280, partial [Lacipirellulaceae bacterium]|nr:hypothetical protein [Lacipirellulaceae bacterium]